MHVMKLKCCAICVVSGEYGINEEENENLNEVLADSGSSCVGVRQSMFSRLQSVIVVTAASVRLFVVIEC